jgi:hypothetical protein
MNLPSYILVTVLSLAASNACAAATLFTDRSLFFQQNTRLTAEDFSEPVGSIGFPGPLDASTGNAEIDPGDIANGLSVDTTPAFANNLYLGVPPLGGRVANTIGNNNHFTTLEFDFIGLDVTAIGLDVYGFNGSSNISAEVFCATGLILSATIDMASAASPSFFGVVAESNCISRIELTRDEDINSFVNVYEIHFGPSGLIGESGSILSHIAAGPAPDTVIICWTSENGVTYALDRAAAFTGDVYVQMTNGLATTPPLNIFTANTVNIPSANFRVRSELSP